MKLNTHRLSGVALLLAALLLVASSARAQASAARGSLSLPDDVLWGKVMIPAGDYTFTLDRATAKGVLTLRSEKRTLQILHLGTFGHEMFGDSTLHLRKVNGTWHVMEMHLTPVGMALCYCRTPIEPGPTQVSKNRGLTKTIRITVQGK